MTKSGILSYFTLSLVITFLFISCKKPKSDIGAVLFKETKNKIFKKIDSAKYHQVFKQKLQDMQPDLRSPGVLKAYYSRNEYDPHFLEDLIPERKIETLLRYYQQASTHGLSSDLFDYSQLKSLVEKIYDKKAIKTEKEAYDILAEAEILTANSLIKYCNAMMFGTVNPRTLFARYYMKTRRPDSASMAKVFAITDIENYLDSIQPSAPEYKKLQEALAKGFQYQGLSKEETAKVIKLNLERLRWKNRDTTDRFVWVNIPDFSLTYFENGASNLTMKVCVGEAKEPNFFEKLKEYNESGDEDDRPFNHETPILSSEIHTIVVNPVWHIPKSIVQNEISKLASQDPHYLANQGIEVYHRGQQVDPYSIDWDEVARSNVKFEFKQSPGEANALGKMKFLFQNGSSVYLHDTPAKSAFNRPNRAVSHGCVRVEDPLALAKAIVGKNNALFNKIQQEFSMSGENSRSFAIKDKVPVYLDYRTCWVDDQGSIEIRPDVYYLDAILFRKMAKYLS